MTDDDKLPKLQIHLGTAYMAKPGHIHLLASPSDYKRVEVFFSKHFDTQSYTHDEIGFPLSIYECKKGSMFLRDESGELIRERVDKAIADIRLKNEGDPTETS